MMEKLTSFACELIALILAGFLIGAMRKAAIEMTDDEWTAYCSGIRVKA